MTDRTDLTQERSVPPGTAAALSLALRKAARDHLGLAEGEFWPSEVAAAQATALLESGWVVIPPDMRCPTCGELGVRACVDTEGRLMDGDHEGRPPFFPPGFDRIFPAAR